MKTVASLIFLTLLHFSFLWAGTASGKPEVGEVQWYQADIVIFRYESTKNMTNEAWPEVRVRDDPPEAIRLTSINSQAMTHNDFLKLPSLADISRSQRTDLDIQMMPFIELPDREQLLSKKAEKLDQSPNYTVLLKMAWRLPIVSGSQVRPVVIESARSDDSTFFIHGLVTIGSNRHLHASVDLWYNEVKPETLLFSPTNHAPETLFGHALTTSQEPRSRHLSITSNFQLKETRIIQKASDTQYFDSPFIGMLLKLTPYEQPSENLLLKLEEKI
ncbi:MAG: CsiV family protein [Candidatus Endonucleobacter bathymodioli]|uniref:CsiV family protein n=1 Tax=Candidatus Endonucleibacter bathymodioli TaxID=539814 RepID=A0AA90NW26_9GAMM|nr:CsiV family protein [Candidatus Endonucleobacter bathymodioli]